MKTYMKNGEKFQMQEAVFWLFSISMLSTKTLTAWHLTSKFNNVLKFVDIKETKVKHENFQRWVG